MAGTTRAQDATATLDGTGNPRVNVLIRQIDNGEILVSKNLDLSPGAKVAPGHHDINVMCSLVSDSEQMEAPGDLAIDVEDSKTYVLTGKFSADERNCEVTVSVR